MSDRFRLLNSNGGVVNTYDTLKGAKAVQKFYEGSKVQELVDGTWVDV